MVDHRALTRAVDTACREAAGAVGVERAVTSALREHIPFDRWCVLTMDPATALPTGGYHDEGLPFDYIPAVARIEVHGEDVGALHELSRKRSRVSVLSADTDGDLRRSTRYTEVLEPSGVAHELRVAYTAHGGLWGALIAFRDVGQRDFDREEADAVAKVTRDVASAIRRELLLAEVGAEPTAAGGPGLVLLDDSLRVTSISTAAEYWLADIDEGRAPQGDLPFALQSLAVRAGSTMRRERMRLRTRRGQWLTLHAEKLGLGGQLSLILEPTRPLELAELIADAYALSPREREVARLLAAGHSRAEIARVLGLSTHTVDGYIKTSYAKVGVQSRAELSARLFYDHNIPRIEAEVPVGGTGWFVR
ncbi:MAG: response regulator transcription factor [Marmoricola sp.]